MSPQLLQGADSSIVILRTGLEALLLTTIKKLLKERVRQLLHVTLPAPSLELPSQARCEHLGPFAEVWSGVPRLRRLWKGLCQIGGLTSPGTSNRVDNRITQRIHFLETQQQHGRSGVAEALPDTMR